MNGECSFFEHVDQLPADPILSLPADFAADPRHNKINLGVGEYVTVDGQPLVMTAVRKAETEILEKNLDKEYLPIEGDAEFLHHSLSLLFGEKSPRLLAENFTAAQTVGCASALRTIGDFIAQYLNSLIFLPQPTWPNHKQIFERARLKVSNYPFFNRQSGQLDFESLKNAIVKMPKNCAILFHASCQNPTGIDPTLSEWKELSCLIKKQSLFPIFDCAYQGFGKSLDEDAEAVRLFAEDGHEMAVAYSFSKNFGLYGERAGFLTILSSNRSSVEKIASHIRFLIRSNYSNPPLHGSRIIKTILKSSSLSKEWQIELSNMRDRVQSMRQALIAALLTRNSIQDFSYLNQQIGLFSFLDLHSDQVKRLREEKAIYMPSNGRVNLAGLNPNNIPFIADAIISIMT
jgi:aspartate/tyrosine/aromatic aminotransferase